MKWWMLAALTLAAQGETRIKIAGRDVMVWKPEGKAPEAGFPAVVFSHGYAGCSTQSKFLMEAFARAGYLAAAANHKDALCGGHFSRPERPFGEAKEWSEDTYKDRAADIEAVLDALTVAKTFQDVPVDAQRIALAGHSLGGYTVLGLAGAWPAWKDPRVKAVLALSPYCAPYIAKGNLARMNVPVMYQGGTLDMGITPGVRRPNGAYERSSAPKYYVEFEGAGHLAWTGLNQTYQHVIVRYSLAFLDRYLQTSFRSLDVLMRKPYPDQVSETRSVPGVVVDAPGSLSRRNR